MGGKDKMVKRGIIRKSYKFGAARLALAFCFARSSGCWNTFVKFQFSPS